ncbi:translation elongation factor Ts [Patescibacteria group bacterium]
MIDSEKIKSLRGKTDVSIMLCKKALEDSGGDEGKAMEWLRQNGVEMAENKSSRGTNAGIIEAYIHGTGQVGVLLEMKSETDFVAKNPAFKDLAHNIAMHIAAGFPSDTKELLEQDYVKNPDINIKEYINESIQKFGENIEVTRFERFAL